MNFNNAKILESRKRGNDDVQYESNFVRSQGDLMLDEVPTDPQRVVRRLLFAEKLMRLSDNYLKI